MRCRLESLGASLPRRGGRRVGSLKHAVNAGREALQSSHYHAEDVALLINAGVQPGEVKHKYTSSAFEAAAWRCTDSPFDRWFQNLAT